MPVMHCIDVKNVPEKKLKVLKDVAEKLFINVELKKTLALICSTSCITPNAPELEK